VLTPAVAPVAYTWTGFYAGGNVGYGRGSNTANGYTSFNDVDIGGVGDFFAQGGNVLPGVSPAGASPKITAAEGRLWPSSPAREEGLSLISSRSGGADIGEEAIDVGAQLGRLSAQLFG